LLRGTFAPLVVFLHFLLFEVFIATETWQKPHLRYAAKLGVLSAMSHTGLSTFCSHLPFT